jgi:hypothetical protein
MLEEIPGWNCGCGMYATFDLEAALAYIDASIISPIFLVEASGKTDLHADNDEVLHGWTSQEMTLVMVSRTYSNGATTKWRSAILAAHQAADYFKIPVVELETMILYMDIQNSILLEDYTPRSRELQKLTRGQIVAMYKESVST